jgi:long-chain fatty acid transport protein
MRAFVTRVAWLALFLVPPAADVLADDAPTESRTGPPPVQYNFAPPGARSLAMGAAFIGLADDATASESNPAGLTILTKPEFSVHGRFSSFDSNVPNTVTSQGYQAFNDKVGSPSFFSFVLPMKQAAVSVYYQRAGDFRSHSFFEGVIYNPSGSNFGNYDQVQTEFRVENFGVSTAFKLGSKISIGGSARLTRVKLDSLQQTTFSISALDPPNDVFLFREYLHPNVSKTAFTWNAGILLTPVNQVSFGAVYKKGARFDFSADFIEDFVDGTPTGNTTTEFSRSSQPVPIRVPDVYGAGIALRPRENWTILADVVRVKYSQADAGRFFPNIYQQFGEAPPGADNNREALADATEFHVGTEYTFSVGNDWLLALRGGYFSDPDHDGLATLNSKQDHFTVGGGVVVKNRLQVDIAGNFAKNIKEALLSFVVRF